MKVQGPNSSNRKSKTQMASAAPARQSAAPSARNGSPSPSRSTGQTAARDRAQLRPEKEAPNSALPNFGSWGTLKRNQSGDNVRSLQDELNGQGARLRQDGIFGPQTEKAVRDFQGRQGLNQDGKVGAQTQEKLKKGLTLKDGMLLSHGSEGKKVRGLQHLLNRHGEALEKDGQFGDKTRDAVRKFQEANHLKVDGIVGPETLKALNSRPKKQGPKAQAEPKPQPQAQPKPEPQAQPKPEPQAQPKPEPQAQPKPEPPAQPRPEPQAPPRPEPQAQPKPEPQAQPRPEPQAQPRPEPPTQPKPEPPAQPRPEPPVQPKPEPPKPQDFGLNPQQLAHLQKGGRLETLRGLPPQAAERISNITPEARQKFAKDLQGSTFGVSHREAFVNGRAMGMDTFQIMDDKLREAQDAGKISPKEAAGMRADLKQLKALSPKQRDAIAELFQQSLRRN